MQGVVQLPPLERLTSAPDGLDTNDTLVESGLAIPGIAEHAERVVPHNANITPRILLPEIALQQNKKEYANCAICRGPDCHAVENPGFSSPEFGGALALTQRGATTRFERDPTRSPSTAS